jgi:hypothetical protein
MTKPVFIKKNTLRFFTEDGWTKDELDNHCQVGSVRIRDEQTSLPYFSLNPLLSSNFDPYRLSLDIWIPSYKSFGNKANAEIIRETNKYHGR